MLAIAVVNNPALCDTTRKACHINAVMKRNSNKLYSLADLEGKVSPHQMQVRGALKQRAAALAWVKDVDALAAYIGGRAEEPAGGGDWAVSKELYPGVVIHFIFSKGDSEFPPVLRALYGGAKIETVKGEELATVTISAANQILRFVRESNPGVKLPEVCYRV